MDVQKMTSMAGKLETFFKVMQRIVGIAVIVVICVLTALTVANAVNPDTVIGTGFNVLEIGGVSIELEEAYAPDNTAVLWYAWGYAVVGALWGGCLYVGMGYLRKMLLPMAEGRPFHPETAGHIRKLAVLSLILGVVDNAGGFLEAVSAVWLFKLDALQDVGAIRSVTVEHSFDLSFVVVFFVLLLISCVFAYGAQLQQLSDETL